MSLIPDVEMLWASSDPLVTLQRFGFADAQAAGQWVASVVDSGWGIEVTGCERIVFSAGNALAWVTTHRGPMIVKCGLYPQLHQRLERTTQLVDWLHREGFPVSPPAPLLTGELRLRAGLASIELQAVMEGSLLDAADAAQARMAGETLARLHLLLSRYPHAADLGGPPWQMDPARGLSSRITAWLDSDAAKVPAELTGTLRQLVTSVVSDDPQVQVVHLDFRSANLLCRGSEMSAVLDFEEAGPDHCVVDLARSAVLLGTQFRDWQPISDEARESFLQGYESVRPLSSAESSWLPILILWWSLQGAAEGWWNPETWLASAQDQANALA